MQADDGDAFTSKLLNYESGEPIRLGRDDLKALPSTEVRGSSGSVIVVVVV